MAFYNLDIADIYAGDTDPTSDVNPKRIGSFYINHRTGEAFTCIDNTKNNNKWRYIYIQDKWKDLGTANGSFNLTLNGANNVYNNFWLRLSGPTNFNQVIANGAAERSGMLVVLSGNMHLKTFFNNAFNNVKVPVMRAPVGSNNGEIGIYPFKVLPNGIVVFTQC